MNNNSSKHDHLWDTKKIKKNVGPFTIMHQKTLIYETHKIFKKNVRGCTIMHQNAIIYETQKILRKMNVPVV